MAPVSDVLPSAVRTIGRGLLDLAYPPRCLGCETRPESPALPLCPRCLQSLERAPEMAVTARLDRPPVGRGAITRALALWVFDTDGTLQSVQHALKYGDRPRYGVADALDCPVRADVLDRPRPTRSQTNLSRTERWKNVRDAFAASDAAAGGHWLLVDDILTTGSTAVAAAQALRDAGADAVSLATLALARQ